MKNLSRVHLAAVCLLALLAGCHRKPVKPVVVKHIHFTMTPNAAAKTIALQCDGSSSGKCGFAFDGGTPGDLLLDIGGTATVTGVAPGGQYCYGLQALNIATCHKRPIPDGVTTVDRDLQPPPAAAPPPEN